ALACDMESAAILEWARARGIPAMVIRAVSDTSVRGVPADLAAVVESDGRVRTIRAVRAVLARPRAFVDALTLRSGTNAALKAVNSVFHVAADYRLWARHPEELHRVNVGGTRAVLEAAGEAGVSRVVYTSTVGALGIPGDGTPGTEATPVSLRDMVGPYKASKFLAEQVALGFAHQGLPVVVVNPSAPVGPWDVKPTPTGRMVADFLEGKMVATLDTGLNLVHVRDVARGHLLAAERGKIGEKYILGNRNISLAEIGALLSEIAGIRPPRVRIPYWVAWSAALSMEAVARVTGAPPRVPLTAVRMAKKRMYFSPARAVREHSRRRPGDARDR